MARNKKETKEKNATCNGLDVGVFATISDPTSLVGSLHYGDLLTADNEEVCGCVWVEADNVAGYIPSYYLTRF